MESKEKRRNAKRQGRNIKNIRNENLIKTYYELFM
jgi:hypothetical protein